MSFVHDLWLMVATQYLVFGLIWLISARNRHAPGNGLLGIGWFNVLLGLGVALGVLRGVLPPQSARTGASLLHISAFVVAWIETATVLELPPRRREVLTVAVGSSALIVWLGTTGRNGDARVAVCFATLAYIVVRMSLLAWRPLLRRHGRGITGAVMSIASVAVLILLAQVVGGVVHGWPLEVDPHSEQSLRLAYVALLGMATINALLGYWVLRHVLGQLERLSLNDALTGLPNRRALHHRLDLEWNRWRRAEAPFAVLCLDIDHFKSINDQYGHPAGDRVLVMIGGAIAVQLRPTDLVARAGGEEFIVVLEGTDELERAWHAAERLRRAVEQLPTGEGALPRPVTLSVGVARVEPGDARVADVVARADAALYQAKQAGRNRVVLSAPKGEAQTAGV